MRGSSRIVFLLVVVATLALTPAAAGASNEAKDNHCFVPFGDGLIDLNEVTGRTEAFVETRFCPTADAGDWWISGCNWMTNVAEHAVYPEGYAPALAEPVEDFRSKLVAVRVVVDPGTAQERSYTFTDVDEILNLEMWSDLTDDPSPYGHDVPTLAYLPVLRPVSIGAHTAHTYLVLSADHWDGLGTDPAVNLVPAGETLMVQRQFEVVARSR